MIDSGRFTSTIEGSFVVFLIGLRINNPLRVDQWLPTLLSMPPMISELKNKPELGLMGVESWLSRTTIMVQYWRSMEQLLAYSQNRDAKHLPAWSRFNRVAQSSSAVGIWHETYRVEPGNYENIYFDMPAFGFGQVGVRKSAVGALKNSAGRMQSTKPPTQ